MGAADILQGVTSCLTSIPSPQYSQLFCNIETGYVSPLWASLSACYLIFCVVNDLGFGKKGNSNVQLVLQNCC